MCMKVTGLISSLGGKFDMKLIPCITGTYNDALMQMLNGPVVTAHRIRSFTTPF